MLLVMMRFRLFATVLACLAVLAGGAATVAVAAAPVGPAAVGSAAGEEPCSHCDDCGEVPCPAPSAACVQACIGVVPSLALTAASLPVPDASDEVFRPARPAGLSGLSPPPDPLPPRT